MVKVLLLEVLEVMVALLGMSMESMGMIVVLLLHIQIHRTILAVSAVKK